MISFLFAEIKKAIVFFWMMWMHLLHSFNDCLLFFERKAVFQKNGAGPLTGNHAKREDHDRYQRPASFSPIDKAAKKLGLDPSGPTHLKPYGEGNCFGASTHFCRRWLETGSFESAVKEFSGGIPYEGVVIQAFYETFRTRCWTYLPKYEKCLSDFILNPKEFKKNFHSQPKTLHDLLEKTERFLESDRKLSYLCFMKKAFKEDGKSLEGEIYATLLRVQKTIDPLEYKKQIEWDSLQVLQEITHLDFDQIHYKVDSVTLFDTLQKCSPGAYLISTPVYNFANQLQGYHALTCIKTESENYVYDSNLGFGKNPSPELTVLKSNLEIYSGKICKENLSEISIAERIKNFLFLLPSPPSHSALHSLYRVSLI